MNVCHLGDCRQIMAAMDAESVDSIVTDPPYGLSFMGKDWDHGVPGVHFWHEALRVAKPGAHLLAFGGTRTFHRLMVAIEDAGWEIRDTLMWVYASGFPKSKNLNGEWQGWGTALKPAWEPIILARKPLIGTVAENVLAWGTGGLNVDGCRVPVTDEQYARNCSGDRGHDQNRERAMEFGMTAGKASEVGRWPASSTARRRRARTATRGWKASTSARCCGATARSRRARFSRRTRSARRATITRL